MSESALVENSTPGLEAAKPADVGERSYQRVLAVAEFAPDDYLIKPFSAAQLFERISAVQ